MDIFNEIYPLYPPNPEKEELSESEISENNEYISRLDTLNNSKKKRNKLNFDDFCLKYSDNLWYLWCILQDYRENNVLQNMSFSHFCSMAYDNSVKY